MDTCKEISASMRKYKEHTLRQSVSKELSEEVTM